MRRGSTLGYSIAGASGLPCLVDSGEGAQETGLLRSSMTSATFHMLFTLLAQILLTSNLIFSDWERMDPLYDGSSHRPAGASTSRAIEWRLAKAKRAGNHEMSRSRRLVRAAKGRGRVVHSPSVRAVDSRNNRCFLYRKEDDGDSRRASKIGRNLLIIKRLYSYYVFCCPHSCPHISRPGCPSTSCRFAVCPPAL